LGTNFIKNVGGEVHVRIRTTAAIIAIAIKKNLIYSNIYTVYIHTYTLRR